MAEDENTNPLDGVLVSEEDYEAAAPDDDAVDDEPLRPAPEAVDADGLADDLADQPDDDGPLDADTMHGTPYTTPMPLVAVGDADAVTDEPTPDDAGPVVVPSPVSAVIRTFVPYLVGWIIAGVAWATTPLGVSVPDGELRAWLTTALPVALGTLYYVFAKWAEKRFPGVPWLGSTRMPLYTPPATGPVKFAVATLASTGYVWWRGGRFTPAFRDSLAEADRLVPGFILTQGGFNGTTVAASAGTHAGDAADFSVRGKTKEQVAAFIEAQRRVGNAAWFRTTRVAKWGTRAHGFTSYHVHVVPNGYAAPSQAAKAQVNSTRNGYPAGYRNGRDGLASNGVDAGPGHTGAFRTRTWWDFKKLSTPGLPATGASGVNAIPRHYTPKPWMTIPVDGILGGVTLSRLQWQLNIRPTGKLDHYTVRALKVWLGNTDDGKGILSPLHVRQLQYRVGFRGTAQDGVWGPVTTKALQRYLNANR